MSDSENQDEIKSLESDETKIVESNLESTEIKNTIQTDEPASIQKPKRNTIAIALAAGIVVAFIGGYFIGVNSTEPQVLYINDAKDILAKAPEPAKIQASVDDDPSFGNPNAPITIIEFSDFQCPYCERFHSETQGLIEKNYVETGKVKIVYRDFPLANIHQNAVIAAAAAECANEQGKFWQYHDILFNTQPSWAQINQTSAISTFKQYGVNLGLSSDFATCLETGKYVSEIQKDYQDGASYGVAGTPAFFIGNDKIGYTKVEGAKPYQEFANTIDQLLS